MTAPGVSLKQGVQPTGCSGSAPDLGQIIFQKTIERRRVRLRQTGSGDAPHRGTVVADRGQRLDKVTDHNDRFFITILRRPSNFAIHGPIRAEYHVVGANG